ncbi:septum formation inhibitor Maf [Vibrio coralliilyticus]|uniref:7-methyl-GTP pyrophosphatase n=1 Tax=Vibrio coralliilyticus TaxID=190893 RepID=A0A2A2MN48_9VIBR|nr:nucleoside triphosphate pyrophosphatase [Vibrio coralliilyticus]ERB66714.1 septum formation inhibitor Maf [Vibrio coralliilyticus OCN008]KJY68350.1 septum formation inhibitor Maf [Vibrio coralliilyticus]NOI76915.1 septum formation inhibitor Maf [Vibrio coralliilyticus]NOJ22364.1 septum formation inhibitor Maf [Vibrio coralliilyticus]PAW01675.1 septum formation inhibitor Maf [Vibrio coralliilyticus]
MPQYQLVLASTSPFRKQLLNKLSVPFETASPDCDETPFSDERPEDLVKRLAKEKAESCHTNQPSLIIGSDQVCVIDGKIIGKPLNRENAIQQLSRQSGKAIQFYTGLALHNTETNITDVKLDTFTVHFRQLTQQQISRYVEKEEPYYCAGSFKSEGLGIALFEKLEGKDPNTLVGLPLIDLIDMLETQGFSIL